MEYVSYSALLHYIDKTPCRIRTILLNAQLGLNLFNLWTSAKKGRTLINIIIAFTRPLLMSKDLEGFFFKINTKTSQNFNPLTHFHGISSHHFYLNRHYLKIFWGSESPSLLRACFSPVEHIGLEHSEQLSWLLRGLNRAAAFVARSELSEKHGRSALRSAV